MPALLQHQLHLCPSTSLVDFTKTIHPKSTEQEPQLFS